MTQQIDRNENEGHYHDFSFLTKVHDDGGFTARVREIPAVFVSSQNRDLLKSEIQEATLDYLKMFDDEHQKAIAGELKPILVTPKNGVVIAIDKFRVQC